MAKDLMSGHIIEILKVEERPTSKRISKGIVGSMLRLVLLLEGEAALE